MDRWANRIVHRRQFDRTGKTLTRVMPPSDEKQRLLPSEAIAADAITPDKESSRELKSATRLHLSLIIRISHLLALLPCVPYLSQQRHCFDQSNCSFPLKLALALILQLLHVLSIKYPLLDSLQLFNCGIGVWMPAIGLLNSVPIATLASAAFAVLFGAIDFIVAVAFLDEDACAFGPSNILLSTMAVSALCSTGILTMAWWWQLLAFLALSIINAALLLMAIGARTTLLYCIRRSPAVGGADGEA